MRRSRRSRKGVTPSTGVHFARTITHEVLK